MLDLSNITLFSMCDDARLDKTKLAADYCNKQARFYDTIIVQKPYDGIEYSRFCVEDLNSIIKSDFCLMIQWDGFIINPQMWDNNFMNYDYIGAPWGFIYNCRNSVGNGGFSLRSKKFLEASSTIKYDHNNRDFYSMDQKLLIKICPEDWFLCYSNYYQLINKGIKFAPSEIAYKFSVEHPHPWHQYDVNILDSYKSFGFHAASNIAAMNLLKETG